LPAYLLADLRDDSGIDLDFSLTQTINYDRFSLLSDIQRRAVRSFLLHLLDDPDYQFGRPQIIRALDDYWTDPATN
jgi:hypothetical protein